MDVKNHEMLIRAFAKLVDKHDNVKLQLIGEGELKVQMEELANSLMIKDKVEFLGLKSNVYPYLNKADVFCLPSKYEGIPMSLIEAMGTGLPIIASNVGGIPDMLTDKKDALLVIPEEDEIAEAFEMLYSDDDLKKKLGVAAKERSQSFSANVMAIKYINVYKM